MPMTQPDKNLSDLRADEALDRVLELLECGYGVRRPDGHHPVPVVQEQLQKRWDAERAALQAALRGLFWVDACESF